MDLRWEKIEAPDKPGFGLGDIFRALDVLNKNIGKLIYFESLNLRLDLGRDQKTLESLSRELTGLQVDGPDDQGEEPHL